MTLEKASKFPRPRLDIKEKTFFHALGFKKENARGNARFCKLFLGH